MRLQGLELHGFKSFADRTTLELRDGVTAIVGSNGCGKSNIADAIRWVLGEQRASAVRGSKMEEVIFQGTTRRRPLNFAEVALRFENSDGGVPIPQSEIEVARKVFREGGSEYFLNRNDCRLKDIHNLLRDTGLGSNAYAVIEGSMIETLLSDRAEERRMLFEEAAGIGRYKDSRHAATRRLEAAEADVARLNDLVNEVDSKVRALARQKRRAERYDELRTRRLELEVWVADLEMERLRTESADAEARREELEQTERVAGAARAAAEIRLEEKRLELVALGQRRGVVAARLEEVRARLDAREREILVAEERRAHSELRLAQLVREREEVERRGTALAGEIERAGAESAAADQRLAGLRDRLAAHGKATLELRGSLAAARDLSESLAARARELARDIAAADGARAAAERRSRELELRSGELDTREKDLEGQLRRLDEQTDLWIAQEGDARARLEAAVAATEAAREEVARTRAAELAARDALRAAEDALARLTAQVEAREALEQSYEGFAPAVGALLSARATLPGVVGPLADYVPTEGDAAAMELVLGGLLQAVVVRDLAAARRVREWFREAWKGGGTLLLLPLDAIPGAPNPEAWPRLLLRDLEVVTGDPLERHVPGRTRVGEGGDVVDEKGVVRLHAEGSAPGILIRREELAGLRLELQDASHRAEAAGAEAEAARVAAARADAVAGHAEETRRVVEAELRRTESEAAAHQHHHGRLRQDLQEVREALGALAESIRSAATEAAQLQARAVELGREAETAAARADEARARVAELQGVWEEARDQESELRVSAARAEADQREAARRASAAEESRRAAGSRLETIEREALALREVLEGLATLRQGAGVDIQALFEARDRESAELADLERALSELDAELTELAERGRAARRQESASAEERHQVELRGADLRSQAERVVERLEVEWARPWSVLRASVRESDGGSPDAWRSALRETAGQLEALGPVNMLAVEEHAEEERRLAFLVEQRGDLVRAREDLVAAIRQINRTAREVFMSTFEAVRGNFKRVFQSLFEGGDCDIWLTDPDDPLESPVEIQASPVGKRTQRIHLLSGGERTLTALALLFGLYLVKPSPFCVMDEVDAPLDDSNVGRFVRLLQDFKGDTQFIVITHNTQTMEAADWVYGVTMEEPGISTIVGVELLGSFGIEGRVA